MRTLFPPAKTETGTTSILLSTPQFRCHLMTETWPVRTHKPTTNMELAIEELELSLRVICKGFIFSFSYTNGLCSSLGFYQSGTLKSRHVIHTWISQEALLEAFSKQDGMQKYTEHTNVPLEGRTLLKLTSIKPQKYMLY